MKLQFKVKKSPDFIFEYLTDMEKFVSVHPVIRKIENKGEKGYVFHETLKFGIIPFSFVYPATVDGRSEEKQIVMRARVLLLTRIELVFTISQKEDCCLVEEVAHFKTPLPIVWMMCSIFKKQHNLLFRNIEKA